MGRTMDGRPQYWIRKFEGSSEVLKKEESGGGRQPGLRRRRSEDRSLTAEDVPDVARM